MLRQKHGAGWFTRRRATANRSPARSTCCLSMRPWSRQGHLLCSDTSNYATLFHVSDCRMGGGARGGAHGAMLGSRAPPPARRATMRPTSRRPAAPAPKPWAAKPWARPPHSRSRPCSRSSRARMLPRPPPQTPARAATGPPRRARRWWRAPQTTSWAPVPAALQAPPRLAGRPCSCRAGGC